MNLNDLVKSAFKAKIIDAHSDTIYFLEDILIPEVLPNSTDRKLVFLYLDNSFASLQTLLSFYLTKHILVLLADSMPLKLKGGLEEVYKPQFIYDQKREGLKELNQETPKFHPKIRLLLSTSGTTGSPKFVKLSDENLIANATSIAEFLPIKEDDITPLNLSLYYSYGLSVLHSNLLKQNTLVVGLPDFFNKEFWTFFETYNFGSLAGVPYNYEILNRLGFTQKQFPSMRYMTQAGGKLPINLAEKFGNFAKQNNFPFFIMYGQTEATARMSYLPPDQLLQMPDSIGIPIPNGEFKIDEETNELLYFGPNVFGGYSSSLKDLENYVQPDFLKTGDLAEERGGFYYITGRSKRMVKLFGQRVNLDETESILKQNFQDTIFSCVSKDDKKMYVFYNDKGVLPESILQILKETLLIHHSAFKIILISDFPKTVNGKIDYQKLIQLYGTE